MFEALLGGKGAGPSAGPSYALFMGGAANNSTGLGKTSTEKHSFLTSVVVAGASLQWGLTSTYGYGNSTYGFTGGGYSNRVSGTTTYALDDARQRYTHASNLVQTTAALSTARGRAASISNSATAYVGLGSVAAGLSNTVEYHQYASGITGSASAATTARNYCCAMGNATYGMFGPAHIGSNAVTTESSRYQYSTHALVTNNLLTGRYGAVTFGNTATGYIAGGINGSGATLTTSQKFTYANSTVAASSTVSNQLTYTSAAGDSTKAYTCARQNGAGHGVFTFADETFVNSASLMIEFRFMPASVSSTPGHF